MADTDIRAARDRIDTVERRLAALQDAGMSTGVLRSQLSFAHGALREGRLADVEPICDEVLSAARQLAELGQRGSAATASVRTSAPGSTEDFQRVKVGRAQIADQVRQVIEDEVKSQAALVPDLSDRLHALEQRLAEVMGHAADAAAVAQRLKALDARLAAAESRPGGAGGGDHSEIEAVVAKAVAEAVPRQATELLQEAIGKLPTRDDLHQIAETLRADLDWRLEKAAAEHGWCSLADVQTSVRKALNELDPINLGGGGGSHLARLEGAMAEFVQQSREQQERLIAALADRVAQHTRGLTRKMLVRESDSVNKARPDPEIASAPGTEAMPTPQVKQQGSSSSRPSVAGIPENEPNLPSSELLLDPVPTDVLERVAADHGHTTNFTLKVSSARTEKSDVKVDMDVESADNQSDEYDKVATQIASSLNAGAEIPMKTPEPSSYSAANSDHLSPHSVAGASIGALSAGSKPAIAELTSSIENTASPAAVETLVTAEVARQVAQLSPSTITGDAELARAVARVLPQALKDEAIRAEIFAMLAMEAATKPGVLGEITGLRRYLKREILAAAQDVAKSDSAIVKVE